MAGRRYDEAQKDVLRRLAEAHEAEILAKATLRRKIEEQFQEQLAGLRYEKSLLMNEALNTVNSRGVAVAKADIHRAVKEGNWEKLKALYALAQDDPRIAGSGAVPQTVDTQLWRAVLVPGSHVTVTRLLDWKRLEMRIDVLQDGFMEVVGEVPYTLSHALFGVVGAVPGHDLDPDPDTVNAWNSLVETVADVFENPVILHNSLPTVIRFGEDGAAMSPRELFDLGVDSGPKF